MANRYSFLDDYSEGCHPAILEALANTNTVQQTAYGNDDYCEEARELIGLAANKPGLPVHFVASGTLANIIMIAAVLRPHEAVIASHIGHIVVRETGAIEATGHKLLSVPTTDGKLNPSLIVETLQANSHYPHMAKPRLVYISNATEVGTVYTREELSAIYQCCQEHQLLLMLDGARLGTALASSYADLTLTDIANYTDLFWIGGTKTGALIGEAIVIPNKELATEFNFHVKQRGALLAKGRLLGIQFNILFKDGLFQRLSEHANRAATRLADGITQAGFKLSAATQSNQVFAQLPNPVIKILRESFDFYIWQEIDNSASVIRLVTSWATPDKEIEKFLSVVSSNS